MLFVSFVWGAKNMVDFPPPLLEKTRSYDFRNSFFIAFLFYKESTVANSIGMVNIKGNVVCLSHNPCFTSSQGKNNERREGIFVLF